MCWVHFTAVFIVLPLQDTFLPACLRFGVEVGLSPHVVRYAIAIDPHHCRTQSVAAGHSASLKIGFCIPI